MIRVLQWLLRLRWRMGMGQFYCLVPGPWPGCSGQRSERQTPRFSAGGWSAFAADHTYHLLDCLQRRVASPRAPHALPGVSFSPLHLYLPLYDYHIDLTFHIRNATFLQSCRPSQMRRCDQTMAPKILEAMRPPAGDARLVLRPVPGDRRPSAHLACTAISKAFQTMKLLVEEEQEDRLLEEHKMCRE